MKRLIKILFSRYAVCALIILAELLGVLLVTLELSSYSIYLFILALAVDVLILFSVICLDENPEYKLTWLAVVLLLPIFGGLLYLIFYKRRMSKREAHLSLLIKERLSPESEDDTALAALGAASPYAAGKAMAILAEDPLAALYRGTEAEYFSSGESLFSSMLRDIAGAKRYIFLEYFIVAEGEMWRELLGALCAARARGVEVRLLYDDVGCIGTLPRTTGAELNSLGITHAVFGRVTPSVSAVHNNRDHRKICVIDGSVAYTGGVNIGDEYINRRVRFGHWRDGGIRLSGGAVEGLLRLFLAMWALATGRCEGAEPYLAGEGPVGDGGFYLPFGSGPYPMYKRQVGKRAIIDIVNQAREYVYVSTPYLVIDYDLTEALCGAARRGVDVRIITPAKADKRAVKVMTKSAYPYLISAGISIYEYTPGFIHEKLLVADDEYALVGTINLDYRSLVHHFEDAVWIYGSPVVVSAREEYMKTLSVSHKMTESEARLKPRERIVRALVRLFSPLL
ncbi:MAG: cardiolipin synthase [Clostridia bacterium]|nr:cardiolipin synthase [Clostridia bacterium]